MMRFWEWCTLQYNCLFLNIFQDEASNKPFDPIITPKCVTLLDKEVYASFSIRLSSNHTTAVFEV